MAGCQAQDRVPSRDGKKRQEWPFRDERRANPRGRGLFEFMLYDRLPAPTARGSQHHLRLEAPDGEQSLAQPGERATGAGYARSMKFDRDLPGFQETWRGSRDANQLQRVNMKVPDGDDYKGGA